MTRRAARTGSPHASHASSPFTREALRTRDGQRVAYAVAGASDGVPVVVLHGGPGSGSQPGALQLFDLTRFRVVLVDQRGTGASTPHGSVRHNRTGHLIDDLEAVRVRLGFERWGVFGGSWGAALALAYAGTHPRSVTGVVMRGLFLTSAREVRGLFVSSRRRAPRAWARLRGAVRCDDRDISEHGGFSNHSNVSDLSNRPAALLARCHAKLQRGGANQARQHALALAWRGYEDAVLASASTRRALSTTARVSRRSTRKLIGKYRIQAHYLMHRCWLGETRLLSLARRAAAAGVPLAAVHGSRDPVCPRGNLQRLARAVPAARVECVRAGHLASDPALRESVARALVTMFVPPAHEGRSMRRAA
ncbi:MAG TPA: alpha/beta fold hydrolase [Paraburkholderia sp.]|nr:alpha/beta fold hydrolase [Paraburkholderia sp.]